MSLPEAPMPKEAFEMDDPRAAEKLISGDEDPHSLIKSGGRWKIPIMLDP